jgi:hypothetical protein
MNKPFDLKAAMEGSPVEHFGNTYKFYRSYTALSDRVILEFKRVGTIFTVVQTNTDGEVIGLSGALSGIRVTMAPKKTKKTIYFNVNQSTLGEISAIAYNDKSTAESTEPSYWCETRLRTAVPVEIEVEE